MDALMLRDEAAKERIRLAEEFLDPRKFLQPLTVRTAGTSPLTLATPMQTINMREATEPTLP